METMTKEEYFKDLAITAITELVELDKKVTSFAGASDVDCSVHADIQDWFDVNGDESTDIYNVKLNDAYDAYVESCEKEKEHIFEVCVAGSFSGTFQVKATDEDDAEEYVSNNLEMQECSMYLCDEDNMVDDFEADSMGYEYEVTSVNDTGEVYEED